MLWFADPTWRLIGHLFSETMNGLNPFAEESRQESRITLLVIFVVVGIFTSLGSVMPFFISIPRHIAIEAFWSAQSSMLIKFTSMIGIFSVLRWEPLQEGIARHRFLLSIISYRRLILAVQAAQLLFVLLISVAVNLSSDLLFTTFVPEKIRVGMVFFFLGYLLVYTTLALLTFFVIQTVILFLRLLHLSGLRYLLLSYLTVVIFTPPYLLRTLIQERGVGLIPYQMELEALLREFMAGDWTGYLSLASSTLITVLLYMVFSGLFMQRRLAERQVERGHRLRSRLALAISRLLFLRPGLSRGVALHFYQSILAARPLRQMVIVLFSLLVGAFNAELLSMGLLRYQVIGWRSQHLGSTYYFIVFIAMGISIYYLLKLSAARRQAWLFQTLDPHNLFWASKRAVLQSLNLAGLLLTFVLAPFMILLGGTAFALSHAMLGILVWTMGTVWHSWNTDHIPFTALIEQDKLLFKRFWPVYLIAIYTVGDWLSRLVNQLSVGQALWFIPMSLVVTASIHLVIHQQQKDLVTLREPAYEVYEEEVLVGFESA